MNAPKNGFRVVWFMMFEAVMTLFIITVTIKTDLFTALAFGGLILLLSANAMSKYSKTKAGKEFVAYNLKNNGDAAAGLDSAPIVLKAAIDGWKLVFTLPFRQLVKVYGMLRPYAVKLKHTSKEQPTKEVSRKLVTQKA